jgi:hypothetical protein
LIPRRIASFEVPFHASRIAAWTAMLFPLLAAFSMTVVTVLWWMRRLTTHYGLPMPVITEVCGLDELRALWPRQPFRFGAGRRPFLNLLVLMQSQAPPFETCEDGHRVAPPTGRAERPATPRSSRSASAVQDGNLSRFMCWFTVAASDAALRLPRGEALADLLLLVRG